MPLLNLYSSAEIPEASAKKLLASASALLAHELHKPEAYVMTSLVPRARMSFGGSDAPCCYAELKNIGQFDGALSKRLSAALAELIEVHAGVPRARVYIEFADARADMWGYDGDTFG
jgi:phenylpyruvate tautomerase PptA (4-oxalocrotonate tautomerase family)